MRMGNDAPVTAKELGKRLGLSQPTVSRILSGANNHRVAPETRQRVMEAAVRLGYRPNAVARSLRRGRTNIVGLYSGYGYLDARNPFQAELIGGLQRAADKRQFDVLLHGVFRSTSTDDIFGEVVNGRVDGLFIHTFPDDPLVARLRNASLPVVALADAVPGIPSVVADDAGGTRLLLDALWERGHRRILYLRPTLTFASVEQRVQAFRAWADAHHIAPEHAPVHELDFEATESALKWLLSLPLSERPTAVCCWNDMTAFDLLSQCRKYERFRAGHARGCWFRRLIVGSTNARARFGFRGGFVVGNYRTGRRAYDVSDRRPFLRRFKPGARWYYSGRRSSAAFDVPSGCIGSRGYHVIDTT